MKDNPEQQDTANIGRYMIIGMWVTAMVLGTVLINLHLERERNPNNNLVTSLNGQQRSITLQRSRNGHYLVTGRINGTEAEFLVDTGATSVSIPVNIAQAAGLPRGAEFPVNTANGVGRVYATEVSELQIGDFLVRDAIAHINPGLSGEVLLGMSVLRNFELELRDDQLIIRDPSPGN